MSEKGMNSYRFGYNEEPTDEMLAQIMKEVAEEARESHIALKISGYIISADRLTEYKTQ